MEQQRCSLSNCLATSRPQGEKLNFCDSFDRCNWCDLKISTATCDLLQSVAICCIWSERLLLASSSWMTVGLTTDGTRSWSAQDPSKTIENIIRFWLFLFLASQGSGTDWFFVWKRFGAMQLEFYMLTCWSHECGELWLAGLRRWKLPCSGPRCTELEAKWKTNKHLWYLT